MSITKESGPEGGAGHLHQAMCISCGAGETGWVDLSFSGSWVDIWRLIP